MKAEDISEAVAKICDANKELAASCEDVKEAVKRITEAWNNFQLEVLKSCAMFVATLYEVGITDPLELIRTAPVKRIFVRWKIRRNVRKRCAQCHYRADCCIKDILLKGRL